MKIVAPAKIGALYKGLHEGLYELKTVVIDVIHNTVKCAPWQHISAILSSLLTAMVQVLAHQYRNNLL